MVVIASHIGFPRNLVYIDNHIGLVVVLVVIAVRVLMIQLGSAATFVRRAHRTPRLAVALSLPP